MTAHLFPGPGTADPYCLWCGVPLGEGIGCRNGDSYCGKVHRKRARQHRESLLDVPLVVCDHPEKVPLPHRGTAIRWAAYYNQAFYSCGCGVYHLTSRLNGHTIEAIGELNGVLKGRKITLEKSPYVAA